MTRYLWDCIYCGYPTNHPSRTCPAHRDMAPPVPGLDEPFPGSLLDAPYDDELASPDDVGRSPSGRPAGATDPGGAPGKGVGS